MGSGQDVNVSPSHYGLVPSCHAALFYSAYTKQSALQEKRTFKDDLQNIQNNEGNQVPIRSNVSPNKTKKQYAQSVAT
jgi:hypothetical protein